MVAQNIAFGIIAAGATFGALKLVTTRNVVHAALWLVVVLASVGASFLLVGAEFVGVTQFLVYIGAVVVLFLFGTMLTRAPIGKLGGLTSARWWVGLVVAVPLFALLAYALLDAFGDEELPSDALPQRTADVSDSIFGVYLVPFEAISILLTAALIGAIVIARRD